MGEYDPTKDPGVLALAEAPDPETRRILEASLLKQTDNGPRPDDPDQDVSA